MASKFTITAELNLQTKNLNQVIGNLKQQFQGADFNVKIKDLDKAAGNIRDITKAAKTASVATNSLGNSIATAAKRFSAITLATGTLVGFTRAIKNAVGDAIEFEREVVKIAQATGNTVQQLKGLTREITSVATNFGVSSKELILAARNLTQAGFAADKVTGALKVLAQTELAATFDSIADTTEGAIALLNQFGKTAQKTGNEVAFLEKSFSAINQVSKEFAVESSDLVTAIRTTGSAFESAGGSLNELLALFTSVRSTTRESAESIATGFRTIFTRTQRLDTINNLRSLGVELQDVEGKFVGPMEAIKRLSAALNTIDPRDFRFNLIVEELGGFRQVSKVIPLIQQFAVTQKALNVAQNSSGSLAKDAATAQQSLAVQIAKTREKFSAFIRDLTESSTFQSTVKTLLSMAEAFLRVGEAIKPIIPLIAGFAAFKIGSSLTSSFIGMGGLPRRRNQGGPIGFARGGLVPGQGNGDTVPAMLTPGEFVIRKSSVKKLGADNLARANKYANGGAVQYYARAGMVKRIKGKNENRENQWYEEVGPDPRKNKGEKKDFRRLPASNNLVFTHLDKLKKGEFSTGKQNLYSNVGLDLPYNWNDDWSKEQNNRGIYTGDLRYYISQHKTGKNSIFSTLLRQQKLVLQNMLDDQGNLVRNPQTNKVKQIVSFSSSKGSPYGFIGGKKSLAYQELSQKAEDIANRLYTSIPNSFVKKNRLDTDYDVIKQGISEKLFTALKQSGAENALEQIKMVVARNVPKEDPLAAKDLENIDPETVGDRTKKIRKRFSAQELLNSKFSYEDVVEKAKDIRYKFVPKRKKYFGGMIEKFALGGPAGKSRGARPITIPRMGTYTFNKPAGADLDSLSSNKQQYKLNAEDRLDYDVDHVNVDVNKLKVSKELLEKYHAADAQKRGYRFEDILLETGMATSLSQVKNARLDGITASGDPFEAKSRKSAIAAGELEDKIYGAIADSISAPEKLARARFNANALTDGEDHPKIGRITVFEDITGGLGAAVNTKARQGYVEEEAAKQAKEEGKMAALTAQDRLRSIVDKYFASGYKIINTQYSPIGDKGVHRDVAALLNKKLGGSYQEKFSSMTDPEILAILKQIIVKKAMGGGIGTDTVPAMLTPGEFVINRKSAQRIGYGALNRMNKVGKYANGGPVHMANGGEPYQKAADFFVRNTGAFSSKGDARLMQVLEDIIKNEQDLDKVLDYLEERIRKAGGAIKIGENTLAGIAKAAGATKTEKLEARIEKSKKAIADIGDIQAKYKNQFLDVANNTKQLSTGFVFASGAITTLTSQMVGLDKATADAVSSFATTFTAFYTVGQEFIDIAENIIAEKQARILAESTLKYHNGIIKADTEALKAHAAAVGKDTAEILKKDFKNPEDDKAKKQAERLGKVAALANGALTGFSLALAAGNAAVAYYTEKSREFGETLTKTIDKLKESSAGINENTIQNASRQAFTSTAYSTMLSGKLNSQSGYANIGGKALAGATIGTAIAPGVGSFAGGIAGAGLGLFDVITQANSQYENSIKDLNQMSDSFASSLFTSVTALNKFNKFIVDIEKKSREEVAKSAEQMASEFSSSSENFVKSQIAAIKIFGSLQDTPDYVKQSFESLRISINELNKAIDLLSANLIMRAAKDIQNAIDLGGSAEEIQKKALEDFAKFNTPKTTSAVNAEFQPRIQEELLRRAKLNLFIQNKDINKDNIELELQKLGGLKKELEDLTKKIAQAKINLDTTQLKIQLKELEVQALQNAKTAALEKEARNKIVGSLNEELALRIGIENLNQSLQRINSTVGNLDAAMSGTVTGLKSSIPDIKVLDLLKPTGKNLDDFNKALEKIRSIDDPARGGIGRAGGVLGNKIADNLQDAKTISVNLESALANAGPGLQNFDKRQVEGFVQSLLGKAGNANGAVGQALQKIINETIKPSGGEVAAGRGVDTPEGRKKIIEQFQQFANDLSEKGKGILQALTDAEEQQRAIYQKINESNQRQLELSLEDVDSYERYLSAVAKARGKELTLADKNALRFEKQARMVGSLAGNVDAIGGTLLQARSGLMNETDPARQGALAQTANRTEQALKQLANQSERTADTLNEIEKIKAQRENVRDLAKQFAIGTSEQRAQIQKDIQGALQVSQTGTFDTLAEDARSGADAILERFKDLPIFQGQTGRQVQNRAIANSVRAAGGNEEIARMIEADTSSPEEKLINELRNIYEEEVAAKQYLSEQENILQQALIKALQDNAMATANLAQELANEFFNLQNQANKPGLGKTKTPEELDKEIETAKEELAKLNKTLKDQTDTFNNLVGKLNDNLQTLDLTPMQLFLNKVTQVTNGLISLLNAIGEAEQQIRNQDKASGLGGGRKPKILAGGGIVYRAGGGSIFQPKGTDTVPAMLSPGEFVIRKSAVDKIGVNNLEKINSGYYAMGGLVYLARGGRRRKAIRSIAERNKLNESQRMADYEARKRANTLPDDYIGPLTPEQMAFRAIARDEQRTKEMQEKAASGAYNIYRNGYVDNAPKPRMQFGPVTRSFMDAYAAGDVKVMDDYLNNLPSPEDMQRNLQQKMIEQGQAAIAQTQRTLDEGAERRRRNMEEAMSPYSPAAKAIEEGQERRRRHMEEAMSPYSPAAKAIEEGQERRKRDRDLILKVANINTGKTTPPPFVGPVLPKVTPKPYVPSKQTMPKNTSFFPNIKKDTSSSFPKPNNFFPNINAIPQKESNRVFYPGMEKTGTFPSPNKYIPGPGQTTADAQSTGAYMEARKALEEKINRLKKEVYDLTGGSRGNGSAITPEIIKKLEEIRVLEKQKDEMTKRSEAWKYKPKVQQRNRVFLPGMGKTEEEQFTPTVQTMGPKLPLPRVNTPADQQTIYGPEVGPPTFQQMLERYKKFGRNDVMYRADGGLISYLAEGGMRDQFAQYKKKQKAAKKDPFYLPNMTRGAANALRIRAGNTAGMSDADIAAARAGIAGDLASQKDASSISEKGLEVVRGAGKGLLDASTAIPEAVATVADFSAKHTTGVDLGISNAISSAKNAIIAEESLKSRSSRIGNVAGQIIADIATAGVGMSSGLKAFITEKGPELLRGSAATILKQSEDFNKLDAMQQQTILAIIQKGKISDMTTSTIAPSGKGILDTAKEFNSDATNITKVADRLKGFASGGSAGSDTIPAMLTPGEFVMNKSAVSKYGIAFMEHLNKGGDIQGFANGGIVGDSNFSDNLPAKSINTFVGLEKTIQNLDSTMDEFNSTLKDLQKNFEFFNKKNQAKGFANGGGVGNIFKPKGSDTVPAMLTPGEFVIRKSAVDKIGVDKLHAINGYAGGGKVAGIGQTAPGAAGVYSINSPNLGGFGGFGKYSPLNLSNATPMMASVRYSSDYIDPMQLYDMTLGAQQRQYQAQANYANNFMFNRRARAIRNRGGAGMAWNPKTGYTRRPNSQLLARRRASARSNNSASGIGQSDLLKGRKLFDTNQQLLASAGGLISYLAKGGSPAPSGVYSIGGYRDMASMVPKSNKIGETAFGFNSFGANNFNSNPLIANRLPLVSYGGITDPFGTWNRAFVQEPMMMAQANMRMQGMFANKANRLANIFRLGRPKPIAGGGYTHGSNPFRRARPGQEGRGGGSIPGFVGPPNPFPGGFMGPPTPYASGGHVDSIPAMLTPGEFVMNKEAVGKHGLAFMNHLNKGGDVQGFAQGGPVYRQGGGAIPSAANATDFGAIANLMTGSIRSALSSLGNIVNFDALNDLSSKFSNLVSALGNIAGTMNGMTMNHSVNIDGQVNIGGMNTKFIAESIKQEVVNLVIGEVQRVMSQAQNSARNIDPMG